MRRLDCSSLPSTSLQATTVSILIWEVQTYCQMHSLLIQSVASLLLLGCIHHPVQRELTYFPKTTRVGPKLQCLKPLLPLKCHTKIIPTSCGVTLQLEPSARAGMFIPVTATHMQQPCFQQTSDQQSNASLHFRQSEFKKKKSMPLKKKSLSLSKAWRKHLGSYLLKYTVHAALAVAPGGPRRAKQGNVQKPSQTQPLGKVC